MQYTITCPEVSIPSFIFTDERITALARYMYIHLYLFHNNTPCTGEMLSNELPELDIRAIDDAIYDLVLFGYVDLKLVGKSMYVVRYQISPMPLGEYRKDLEGL